MARRTQRDFSWRGPRPFPVPVHGMWHVCTCVHMGVGQEEAVCPGREVCLPRPSLTPTSSPAPGRLNFLVPVVLFPLFLWGWGRWYLNWKKQERQSSRLIFLTACVSPDRASEDGPAPLLSPRVPLCSSVLRTVSSSEGMAGLSGGGGGLSYTLGALFLGFTRKNMLGTRS